MTSGKNGTIWFQNTTSCTNATAIFSSNYFFGGSIGSITNTPGSLNFHYNGRLEALYVYATNMPYAAIISNIVYFDSVFNCITQFNKRVVAYGDSMTQGVHASTNSLGVYSLWQSYMWPENEYFNAGIGGLQIGTNGDAINGTSMFADATNRCDYLFNPSQTNFLILNGAANDCTPAVGNQTALVAYLRYSNNVMTRLTINPGWRPYYWFYGNNSNNTTLTARLIEFNGRMRTNNPTPQCAFIDFGDKTSGAGGNQPYDQRLWYVTNAFWFNQGDLEHANINAHRLVYAPWLSLPFTASRRSTGVISQ
jgi:hypothetical protein